MRCSSSSPVPPALPEPPPGFEDAIAKEQPSVEHPRDDPSTASFANTVPGHKMLLCESWEEITRRIIREELADALAASHSASHSRRPSLNGGMLDTGKGLFSESYCDRVVTEQLESHMVDTPVMTNNGSTDIRASVEGGIDKQVSTLKRMASVPSLQGQLSPLTPSARVGLVYALVQRAMRIISWWQAIEEPVREGRLYEFVDGTNFQVFIAMIIGLNSVTMGVSTDFEVLGRGPSPVLKAFEVLFTFIYAIELSMKVIVHKQYFFCNDNMRWNVFDFMLVGLSTYDLSMDLFLGGGAAFNASFMRSLRILRAGKVLRIFRLVRAISQLRLILNVLMGSMAALFWSLVMMVIMYYICGLVFVQGAAAYFGQDDISPYVKQELEEYFGSVAKAMRTMFMATTGGEDWTVYYNAISHTGGMYSGLFIAYIAFITVAFLNVLTALFVEHAIETAKPGREDFVLFQRQARMMEAAQLTKLFEEADKDDSGKISVEEFTTQMEDYTSPLRVYLEADGIDATDAALFFSLLKSCTESDVDGEQDVDIKAFVMGLMKIRGGATSLDVQGLVWQTQVIYKTMMKRFRYLEELIECQPKLAELRKESGGVGKRSISLPAKQLNLRSPLESPKHTR